MTARDIRYGRGGGRFVAWDVNLDVGTCGVCAGAMTVGQKDHHYSCSPPCIHGNPVDLCRGFEGACS